MVILKHVIYGGIKNMKHFLSRFWLVIFILGLSAALITNGYVAGAEDAPTLSTTNEDTETTVVAAVRKIPVLIEIVETGTMSEIKTFTGKIKAVRDVMVIPIMPGEVEEILVSVGDYVQQGDLLMVLDDSNIDSQVNQAQVGYNTAKSQINDVKSLKGAIYGNKSKLEKALKSVKKQITSIKSAVSAIKTEIANLKSGYAAGAILDAVYTPALEALEANLKLSEDGYTALLAQKMELDGAISQIALTIKQMPSNKTLNAQLTQAKTGLNMAKDALDNAKIKAPISGFVYSITVEVGDMASQQMPPVSLVDLSTMVLDIGVTEFDVNKIQKGQQVLVNIDAARETSFSAVVEWISPSPDQRLMTYPVRILIDNVGDFIKPGMFAQATLIIEEFPNVTIISSDAVIKTDIGDFAYVIDADGIAAKRTIKTGFSIDGKLEVLSGLASGDRLVVSGQTFLQNGSIVEIVEGDE